MEQFKASIVPPQGMLNSARYIDSSKYLKDPDDEFFHITCHVDPSLQKKLN